MSILSIKAFVRLGAMCLLAGSSLAHGQTLTLQEYLRQAQSQDPSFHAAELQARGAADATLVQDAITDTQVFLDIIDSDDKRPVQNPIFQGTRTYARGFSLGFRKQTEWGARFSVSQNFSHTTILNADRTVVPEPDFYDAFPEFQTTVPLWRNFFGFETKAELNRAKAEADVRRISAEIQLINAGSQIEMAYYTHQTNQETVKIHAEILNRAQKIAAWVQGQRRRGLVDPADVHQAVAAVTLRRLELEMAMLELQNSARRFNDLRGLTGDEVKEELTAVELDPAVLRQERSLTKIRKDLLVEQATSKMQEMEFRTARETAKPQLDLALKAQWLGRADDIGNAYDEIYAKDQPYYFLSLQFSMPLNVPKYLSVRKGLALMMNGERLRLQAQRRDARSIWENFVDLGEQLSRQIQLLRELENTQKLKSASERQRFQGGRSTTFQVLSFEQDYISARSRRITVELRARQYLTQLALFEPGREQ